MDRTYITFFRVKNIKFYKCKLLYFNCFNTSNSYKNKKKIGFK